MFQPNQFTYWRKTCLIYLFPILLIHIFDRIYQQVQNTQHNYNNKTFLMQMHHKNTNNLWKRPKIRSLRCCHKIPFLLKTKIIFNVLPRMMKKFLMQNWSNILNRYNDSNLIKILNI